MLHKSGLRPDRPPSSGDTRAGRQFIGRNIEHFPWNSVALAERDGQRGEEQQPVRMWLTFRR